MYEQAVRSYIPDKFAMHYASENRKAPDFDSPSAAKASARAAADSQLETHQRGAGGLFRSAVSVSVDTQSQQLSHTPTVSFYYRQTQS